MAQGWSRAAACEQIAGHLEQMLQMTLAELSSRTCGARSSVPRGKGRDKGNGGERERRRKETGRVKERKEKGGRGERERAKRTEAENCFAQPEPPRATYRGGQRPHTGCN